MSDTLYWKDRDLLKDRTYDSVKMTVDTLTRLFWLGRLTRRQSTRLRAAKDELARRNRLRTIITHRKRKFA